MHLPDPLHPDKGGDIGLSSHREPASRHRGGYADETKRNVRIDLSVYGNSGFDVVDARAKKVRNRIAIIRVKQQGEEKKYTFHHLSRLSNRLKNIFSKNTANKNHFRAAGGSPETRYRNMQRVPEKRRNP
jgi:hypothetical protein